MKLNIRKDHIVFFSMLVVLFGNFLNYINTNNVKNSLSITYFFIIFPIFTGCIVLLPSLKYKYHFKYVPELRTGVFVGIAFLLISIYKAAKFGLFTMGTLGEVSRLIVPFIYTFLIINFLSFDEINLLMKISIVVAWLGFIMSQDFSNISLSTIAAISFENSYSPFENSEIAMLAYATMAYFIYHWKNNKSWTFISILLTFLSFKRVFILGVLFLTLITFFRLNDKKVSKLVLWISSIAWILLANAYMFMLYPQNYFWDIDKLHLDINNFSMSRAYRVWYLIQNNYVSYGLGSTTQFLKYGWFSGTTLELDFIKIIMELGSIGIVIFVIAYYRLVRSNLYAFVLMSFNFLQLLMANGLTNYFEWTILLTTVAVIYYEKRPSYESDDINWPFFHVSLMSKNI